MIAILGNDQLTWYISRSSGITAWALAAASVLWGLFLSTGILQGRPRRPWLLDLHRYLGGLTIVFTVIHLAALVADDFVQFDIVDLLVPFASEWRPGAVAWGVVAFWLLLAVQITSLLRRRGIPERIWRAVHASSFLLFAFATVHGLQAGTDAESAFIFWPAAAVTGAVIFLSWWRILVAKSTHQPNSARSGSTDTLDAHPHQDRDLTSVP